MNEWKQMFLEKSNGDKKFNVEVRSISYNDNEDLINSHILKLINEYDADYVVSFSEEMLKNREIVEISNQSQDLCDFGWNYFSGFKFTMLNPPLIDLNDSTVEYITNAVFSNDCIDTDPRLIFKMSVFPFNLRSRHEYANERFDLPIFLEEMLNMKILLILKEEYMKHSDEIEESILNEIKSRIDSNIRSAVSSRVKDAKVSALVRESLDKKKIDWRSFPEDAKRGVYHDDVIIEEEERIDGKKSRFYRIDNKPKGEFDGQKFAKKFCKKMKFDKLCKLFYSEISWKNFYTKKLHGDETELFYKDSSDWVYLRRGDIGDRDKFHRNILRGICEIGLHMDDNNKLVKSDDLINVLVYYRYLQNLDPNIIAKIARDVEITSKEITQLNPDCEMIPDPVYIKSYVEVDDKQQRISDSDIYRWEMNLKNKAIRNKLQNSLFAGSRVDSSLFI